MKQLLAEALGLAVIAVVGLGSSAAAADDARRPAAIAVEAIAIPAGTTVVIDGKFTEEIWSQAPTITEFVQREPAEGEAPSQQTDARVAYDENALYVAVRAQDSEPQRIVGLLTRRDQRSPSDWIRVIVDSFYDRRSAYEFGVNPAGVKTDRYYFNDGNSDDSWDAVWDVQVVREADGWHAEFRIPFSQLRFNKVDGGPVGFAVMREIGRLAEVSSWPLLSRNANGFVSQFGEVTGLRMGGTPKKLELVPYSLGSVSMHPETENPIDDQTDPDGSLGLDLKYALAPGLTLTATANPDFGQVEADPAVVNLDAFETFFQERRPFFVEGSGTFQFNLDCNDGACTGLFYSRRIGRAPQGSPELEDDEYSTAPQAATIIGAGKVTGRVGDFSVGALTALTAVEEASIWRGGPAVEHEVVEPLTGYTVVRARREFTNQSNLGVMLTATNRSLVDAVSFLPDDAYAAGVDYDIRFSPRYSLAGFWSGSHVSGSTEAITELQENNVHAYQRPDADYLGVDPAATSLGGHAGGIRFGKIAGEKTRFAANYGYKSPGFEINDLGFQRRADERFMGHWFQKRDNVPGRFTRSFIWNLNQYAGWNYGGDRVWNGANINMHWNWKNYATSGFGLNYNGAPFRDRVTRGGPGVLGNTSFATWYYSGTDSRKNLSAMYEGFVEVDGKGTFRHNINPFVTWRPSAATSLSTGFRYNINNDDAQWVENEEIEGQPTRYVFARLEQRTVAFTFRFNYTMTANLSFQSYAEPFVSAGDYTNYKELVNGRAPNYSDRYAPYAYTGDANFNYRSFRTTNVLRWEYKPGSTLFVVWQQGRESEETYGDFRFGRDFTGVFDAPSNNVFLVKLSYWLNM